MPPSADESLPLLPKQPSHSPLDLPTSSKALILVSAWTLVFLGALDTTIIATLVGPISSSFHASHQASWLGTSFLATLAGCTPAYGRLSDIYGRRSVLLFALSLFTIGTLGCAYSSTFIQLVSYRALAGCGGGGLMVLSSIIGSDLVPLRKRGLLQGFGNLFYGTGSALGGPVGGLISEHYGWRVAFGAQVPVLCLAGALVAAFVHYELPKSEKEQQGKRQIDWAGSVTILSSVAGLLVALSSRTNQNLPVHDWRVWVPAVVSFLALVLFFVAERRCREPILPMRLLSHRSSLCTLLLNFFNSGTGFSILYYYPLFQQVALGQTSAEAGVHLIPNSVAASIGSLGAGYIMRHTGRFFHLTLLSALAPGMGLIALTQLSSLSPEWLRWASITPVGLGMGSTTTCALIALIAHVARQDIAVATASSYLFRYTGQVVGVATSGAVLQWVLVNELHKRISDEELIDKIRKSSEVIPELDPWLQKQATEAYTTSLHAVFWCNIVVVIVAGACAFCISEKKLAGSRQEEEEQQEDEDETVDN